MDKNVSLTVLPHVRWALNNDGAVLFDTNTGSMFGLNGTGRLMWKCLAEGYSSEKIIDCVISEYGIDRTKAATDFEVFFADLKNKGLVDRRAVAV